MKDIELDSWIRQLESGDNAPLGEVMQRYGSYCVGNLRRLFNCSLADAEDIFMDSLIEFRKNMISGKVTVMENLKGYVFAICKNKYLKKYQQKKKEKEKQDDLAFYFYSNRYTDEEYDQLVKTEVLEEGNDKKQKLIIKIQKALKKLNTNCQKILKLLYVEEKSMDEIARLLKFENKNVAKSTKYRCFKKWRTEIDKLFINQSADYE